MGSRGYCEDSLSQGPAVKLYGKSHGCFLLSWLTEAFRLASGSCKTVEHQPVTRRLISSSPRPVSDGYGQRSRTSLW